MRARLFSRVGETKGEDFEIEGVATIGRHPENEIVLAPSLVSSHHARITYDAESRHYLLEDLGSLNGTALDGHKVTARERLGHLHVITFAGKHDFIFQDLERCAERHGAGATPSAGDAEGRREERTSSERLPVALPGPLAGLTAPEATAAQKAGREEEKTSIERSPVGLPGFLAGAAAPQQSVEKTAIEKLPAALPDVLAGEAAPADTRSKETAELEQPADKYLAVIPAEAPAAEVLELLASGGGQATFHLEIVEADGGVARVELADGENLVGRGSAARIRPDSLDLSRRHALLTVAGGRVKVRDLGSRNRTYLEGEEIDTEVEVKPGARLRFGSVEARLVVQTGD